MTAIVKKMKHELIRMKKEDSIKVSTKKVFQNIE